MNTIKFSSELGVNEGYNIDDNGNETLGIEQVGKLLQDAQLEVQKLTGIYVSTVVNGPNRTIYNTEWGCPVGGELTYNISSTANPAFTPSTENWKIATLLVMDKMRSALKQTTVSVEFTDKNGVDFYYLNDDKAIDRAIKEINQAKHDKDAITADDILSQ